MSKSTLRSPAYTTHRYERRNPNFKSQNLLPEMPGSVHAKEEVPRY